MVFDCAWVRPLDFFYHPKIVRRNARVARSDYNVTLTEKYENPVPVGVRNSLGSVCMGKTLFSGMGVKRRRKRHNNDMNWSTGKHLEARGSPLKLMECRE